MAETPIKRNMLDTATIKTNQAQTYFERANPTKKDLEQALAHLKDALDLTKAMVVAIDHDCFEVMDRPPTKPEPGPRLFDLEDHAEAPAPTPDAPAVPAEPVAMPGTALPTLGCIDVEIVDANRVTQEEQDSFESIDPDQRLVVFDELIADAREAFGNDEGWAHLEEAWRKAFAAHGRAGETEAWVELTNRLRANADFELPNACTGCGIILVDDEAQAGECSLCSGDRETRNEAAKLAKPEKKAPKKSKKGAAVQAADPEPPEDEVPHSDGPAYPGGTGEEQFAAFSGVLGELEDRFCDSETVAGRRDFGGQLKAFRPCRKAWRGAWEKDQIAAWNEINLALSLSKTVGGFSTWSPATR